MKDKLNWVPWLYGLFSALIGGGATVVVSGFANAVIAPESFNATHPQKLLESIGTMFVVSGLVSAAMYLKQSPLPSLETTTTTEVTTIQQNPPAVVVKTVETKEANKS